MQVLLLAIGPRLGLLNLSLRLFCGFWFSSIYARYLLPKFLQTLELFQQLKHLSELFVVLGLKAAFGESMV